MLFRMLHERLHPRQSFPYTRPDFPNKIFIGQFGNLTDFFSVKIFELSGLKSMAKNYFLYFGKSVVTEKIRQGPFCI